MKILKIALGLTFFSSLGFASTSGFASIHDEEISYALAALDIKPNEAAAFADMACKATYGEQSYVSYLAEAYVECGIPNSL